MGEGKISRRFRNIISALFILSFIFMLVTMLFIYNRIITQVSFDYAGRFAISSAKALSSHIEKEIGLLAKAARSRTVVEWMTYEDEPDKKALAYEELADVARQLYSSHLYVGVQKSLQEYYVMEGYGLEDMQPVTNLDRGSAEDGWFFACVDSDNDYILSVDVDHILQKKRVWLDHKVTIYGMPLGVVCTGLEFSHIVQELFSQADNAYMRSLIVDDAGMVLMDSALMEEESFLYDYLEISMDDAFADPFFLAAMKDYIQHAHGYFKGGVQPVVVRPSSGPYRYATITPIPHTAWSAVILYDSSSLLSMTRFLPAFTVILLLLIAFTLATDAVSNRLIFTPLDLLIRSLPRLLENHQEHIYGVERDDEFGSLSRTINDLFTKANYDALTGVYNRRYMENLLQQHMEFLSRSQGYISVLMADVDFFKRYNDAYGHQEGDRCLIAVAKAMAGSMNRNTDFVARYGGEEFIAVLPNTDEMGARLIAGKILDNVRQLNIPHKDSSVAQCVTVSLGVTTGKVAYMQNGAEYIKQADDALYQSKQNGRNRYTYLVLPAQENEQ